MRKCVAIDVDGVLAQYDSWEGIDVIGSPIPGAVEFVAAIAVHYDVIIHSCRCTSSLNRLAVHLLANKLRPWLDGHDFVYHHIWTEEGKPVADYYIDDRGVYCNPQKDSDAFMTTLQVLGIEVSQ
jgi:adenylylsulfate kinase